jgi:hypothetical protein
VEEQGEKLAVVVVAATRKAFFSPKRVKSKMFTKGKKMSECHKYSFEHDDDVSMCHQVKLLLVLGSRKGKKKFFSRLVDDVSTFLIDFLVRRSVTSFELIEMLARAKLKLSASGDELERPTQRSPGTEQCVFMCFLGATSVILLLELCTQQDSPLLSLTLPLAHTHF